MEKKAQICDLQGKHAYSLNSILNGQLFLGKGDSVIMVIMIHDSHLDIRYWFPLLLSITNLVSVTNCQLVVEDY